MNVITGAIVQIQGSTLFASAATGGSSSSGPGGNATGGNVLLTGNNAGAVGFADNTGVIGFDTSSTAGLGAIAGTTASAGGTLINSTGTILFGSPVVITGNTSVVIEAGGDIGIGSTITGTGDGAYLQLHADSGGAGNGTVRLVSNAINLTGVGAAVDIDYNPAALGTPTNFAPGVAAGLLTAYQLVDDVNQLQLIGTYLSQNFAFG